LLAIDYAEYKRLLALPDPAEKLVRALKRLYKLHYEFLDADERAEYKQIIENYENDNL
jgi:phosphopantothenate synthetase